MSLWQNASDSQSQNPAHAFSNNRNPKFYFASHGHAEALSRLQYLVTDQSMIAGLLTGEIGCGKTLISAVLTSSLDRNQYLTVEIESCLLNFDDLLLEIISQIKQERVSISQFPDRYSRLAEFKRLLMVECFHKQRHLVILLDEAQQLSDPCLDALRSLTNIASNQESYLTLLLVGQPELRQRVRSFPQLDQRISLRFHLNELSLQESVSYLEHRISALSNDIVFPFTTSACDVIARASQGVPRNINRLAKLSLDYIFANQNMANAVQIANEHIVNAVISDLDRQAGSTMLSTTFNQ